MISQDKKPYLEYIKQVEQRVNDLYRAADAAASVPAAIKKDIENTRIKIFGKIVSINFVLDSGSIFTDTDWAKRKQHIEILFKELSDKVAQAMASVPRTNDNAR